MSPAAKVRLSATGLSVYGGSWATIGMMDPPPTSGEEAYHPPSVMEWSRKKFLCFNVLSVTGNLPFIPYTLEILNLPSLITFHFY